MVYRTIPNSWRHERPVTGSSVILVQGQVPSQAKQMHPPPPPAEIGTPFGLIRVTSLLVANSTVLERLTNKFIGRDAQHLAWRQLSQKKRRNGGEILGTKANGAMG